MRKIAALLITALLAACGAQPAAEFRDAREIALQHEGREYRVFHKGNRAEIIRLGYVVPGRHRATREVMVALMEKATGCRIIAATLQGDSGEMRSTLRCPTPG